MSKSSTLKSTSDGWRGLIDKEFNIESITALVKGFIQFLRNSSVDINKGILIGYDTRHYSRDYADKIANWIASYNIPIFLAQEAAPSPVTTLYAIEHELPATIILTASHYPGQYNGIKFRIENGRPPLETELESIMLYSTKYISDSKNSDANMTNRLIHHIDIKNWYVRYVRLKYSVLLNKLKLNSVGDLIVIDVMNGTTGGILPELLRNLDWKVIEMRTEIDPDFGNSRPDPIKPNCKLLMEKVISLGAKLGVAFDGDGDRVSFIDPVYGYVGAIDVPVLTLLSVLEQKDVFVRSTSSLIVKTLPVTYRVDQLAEREQLSVAEVPVGFRNIYYEVVSRNALVGFGDDTSVTYGIHNTKDAIFTSLCVIWLLTTGTLNDHLNRIEARFKKFHYIKNNITCKSSLNVDRLMDDIRSLGIRWDCRKIIESEDGIKIFLSDGWILLRISGTENYIRIYAEGADSLDLNTKLESVYSLIAGHTGDIVEYKPFTELN